MSSPSIPMLVKSIKATKTGFVYSLVSDYDLNDGADAVDFHKLKLYTSRLFEDIQVGDHVEPCLHAYQPIPAPGSGLSGLLASLLGDNPAFQGGAFPGQTFTVPSPHDRSQERVKHPVFGEDGLPEAEAEAEAEADEKWKQYYSQVSGEGVPVVIEYHEDNTVRPQIFEENDYPTGHHEPDLVSFEPDAERTAWAESQAEINERRNDG
jgi:hypothetical protein